MSSKEIYKTIKNQAKDYSEAKYDADLLASNQGQRNIQTSIEPTGIQTGTRGKSHKMDWETSSIPTKPPTASFRSSVENKPEIEDVRNITTDFYKTKLSSDESYSKQSSSYLLSPQKKSVIPTPTSGTMMQTHTDLSMAGPSGSKFPTQNPLTMTKSYTSFRTFESSESNAMILNSPFMAKDYASSSSFGPSESKASTQNPSTMTERQADLSVAELSGFNTSLLNPSAQAKTHNTFEPPQSKDLPCKTPEFPPRKRKIADTYELADACKYFLTFMKAKRSDLKYQESQLDIYTTNIQKALRDAEQVCFKLEAEPEAIAEEMSAAITQSQKLAYLLSISYRCFSKLDELGTKLHESLQTYTNDAENFHLSVDRLLDYIIGTIFEKCRQLGTL